VKKTKTSKAPKPAKAATVKLCHKCAGSIEALFVSPVDDNSTMFSRISDEVQHVMHPVKIAKLVLAVKAAKKAKPKKVAKAKARKRGR